MNILSIHWANNNPQGLRVFDDEDAAIGAGENPKELHSVAGVLIKWPKELGDPPTDEAIAQWESDYLADQSVISKRESALAALAQKRHDDELTAAISDKNAPQAVREYAAALKGK